MSTKQVKYSITLSHAEKKQAPLDRLIQSFETDLRSIGYTRVNSSLRQIETKGAADSPPPVPQPAPDTSSDEPVVESADSSEARDGQVRHKGGGYYELVIDGEAQEKTYKGKAAAERALKKALK